MSDYITNNNVITRAMFTTSDEFIDNIKQLNTFYASITPRQFTTWGIKTPDTILRKIHEAPTNLYFGLYTNFEWLDRIVDSIIHNISFDKLQHYSSTHRVTITKALRTKVWNSALVDGSCYCCGDTITNTTFECGHVIPITIGGPTTSDNLRAICRQCNCDMKTQNLEEYKLLLEQQI